MLKQYNLTPAAGKRLIGKGMAAHPAIQKVLREGTLVITAGTTNGYVAEEILGAIDQGDAFSRTGFRRGVTVAPGRKAATVDFPGDVIIRDGEWVERGATIYDVVDDLRAGDVILKGANAFDIHGQPAVQIGHPQGGTILQIMAALIGRRVQLIAPVGLEKRVFGHIHELAQRCNAADASGVRLFPFPGRVFTELDAIRVLTGAEAILLSGGGVCGAEGSAWLGVQGDEAALRVVDELLRSVADEPPCEV
jgi:uncharacterized Zn-binding protein involved in type VI secretion